MKRTKTLIILCAALAVLICAFLVVKNISSQLEGDDEETTAAETYSVSDVTADNLSSVNITVTTEADGEAKVTKLSFALSDDQTKWLWSEDAGVPLDNTAFANIVTALSEATSTVKKTEVTEEKLSEFGLTSPYIEAKFGFSDGTEVTYRVGSYNKFNSMYYFCDASDLTTVYMVSSDVTDALDITVKEALLWDEIPEITASKITSLTFDGNGHKYVYTYYPTGKDSDYTSAYNWYLSVDGGTEIAVSSELATDLTTALTSLSFDDVVYYTGEVSSEYGLSSSAVTMTIAYGAVEEVEDSDTGATTEITKPSTYVLTLGAADEDGYFYAKTADSQLIYTLYYSDVLATAQSADLTDIRPAELISLDFDRIDSIKLKAGSTVLDVNIAHEDATATYTDASGATFKYTAFTAITDALSALKASSYTSLVDPVASEGTDLVFSADLSFNTGDTKSAVLEIRNYSDAYYSVSFMGREDQLVAKTDVATLITALEAYATAAEDTTAAEETTSST